MKVRLIASVFSLVAGLLGALAGACNAAELGEQLGVVQLRWTSNQVTVVRAQVVSGRLKRPTPEFEEGKLRISLADVRGNSLIEAPLEDPRQVSYEVPENLAGGGLRQIAQVLPMVETLVRLPMKAGATHFRLLGTEIPSTATPSGRGPAPAGVTNSRPVILTHPLPISKPAQR